MIIDKILAGWGYQQGEQNNSNDAISFNLSDDDFAKLIQALGPYINVKEYSAP